MRPTALRLLECRRTGEMQRECSTLSPEYNYGDIFSFTSPPKIQNVLTRRPLYAQEREGRPKDSTHLVFAGLGNGSWRERAFQKLGIRKMRLVAGVREGGLWSANHLVCASKCRERSYRRRLQSHLHRYGGVWGLYGIVAALWQRSQPYPPVILLRRDSITLILHAFE